MLDMESVTILDDTLKSNTSGDFFLALVKRTDVQGFDLVFANNKKKKEVSVYLNTEDAKDIGKVLRILVKMVSNIDKA